MEPVYTAVESTAKALSLFQGLRMTRESASDNIPAEGGAVLAVNHTGYLDFVQLALAVGAVDRKLRLMAKAELANNKVMAFLMRGCGVIPVDRTAGAGAYLAAVERLARGRTGGCVPGGDHQPELRDQGTEVGCGAHGDRRAGADRARHRVGRSADRHQGQAETSWAASVPGDRRGRPADRAAANRRKPSPRPCTRRWTRSCAGCRTDSTIRRARTGCPDDSAAVRPPSRRPPRWTAAKPSERAGAGNGRPAASRTRQAEWLGEPRPTEPCSVRCRRHPDRGGRARQCPHPRRRRVGGRVGNAFRAGHRPAPALDPSRGRGPRLRAARRLRQRRRHLRQRQRPRAQRRDPRRRHPHVAVGDRARRAARCRARGGAGRGERPRRGDTAVREFTRTTSTPGSTPTTPRCPRTRWWRPPR